MDVFNPIKGLGILFGVYLLYDYFFFGFGQTKALLKFAGLIYY